ITGLSRGDKLGIVESGSIVDAVGGATVKVADPDKFADGDVVMLLRDPVEPSALSTVAHVDPAAKDLDLSSPISGLATGNVLSVARPGGVVKTATNLPSEVKVTVANNIRQFRAGDLVAKRFENGTFSPPVRVKVPTVKTMKLTLSGSIPGL